MVIIIRNYAGFFNDNLVWEENKKKYALNLSFHSRIKQRYSIASP
jgi:hypothetical protein